MWHCYLKIAYYSALIVYHCVDFVFDWVQFVNGVCIHGRFVGIPTKSDAIKVILGFSCTSGTFCSLFMVLYVYKNYIKFHWKCIKTCRSTSNSKSVKSNQVELEDVVNVITTCPSKRSDDHETETTDCDRRFVLTELIISNMELYLKDGMQSALLMYMYESSGTRLGWHNIIFAVCSIAANFKLLICFMTKLLGCGSGEKIDCESWKCRFCLVGCVGSLVFEALSIVYLVFALS